MRLLQENEKSYDFPRLKWVQVTTLKPKLNSGWVNIYVGEKRDYALDIYPTKDKASNRRHGHPRIACVQVSYHVGQGLEDE